MSDVALRVENLGKKYRLTGRPPHHSLREALVGLAKAPLAMFARAKPETEENTFWALKGIDFEVRRGEVLGLIGRNGAGKSTLLKVLSRITEPTEGSADLYGRIGSLLEVGTGFKPELSGRENIFLNGAILGMGRKEIERKFDEIVAFAEVERFIDAPVKHYSSGMYTRLAFAVAAHLESEILIVDEVLAVGDAVFQKKCLGRMSEVAGSGRTIIFVSHQMGSISRLCSRVICLHQGRMDFSGGTAEGISRYYARIGETPATGTKAIRRAGTGDYRAVDVRPEKPMFSTFEPKIILMRVEPGSDQKTGRCWIWVTISDEQGNPICQCDSRINDGIVNTGPQSYEVRFELRTPWLKPGDYYVSLQIRGFAVADVCENVCSFRVLPILPYEMALPEEGFEQGQTLADFAFQVGEVATQTVE